MQKVINVLAVLGFVGTTTVIGGGAYVYVQRDAILDGIKKQVTEYATEAITNALPDLLDGAVPEVPGEVPGSVVPEAPVNLPNF